MSASRLLFTAIVMTPLLASCVGAPQRPYRTADGEALLARELSGKVAGAPVSCLPHYRSSDMTVIDADTILFRDGRRIYVQNTNGHCYPYHGNHTGYALVTKGVGGGGGLCRGDIASVVDTTSGMFAGSCSFNDFIPYDRPRS